MLPDLSNKIKTLAGTSAVPDPGGKAFEYEFEIIKQVNKKTPHSSMSTYGKIPSRQPFSIFIWRYFLFFQDFK
jgi:hypothetical protein